MKTERKEIQKIEYVTTYIANDGTEFKSEEECKKYETTAKCAVNVLFNSVPKQTTPFIGEKEPFCDFGSCDNEVYAVKIRSIDDLDAVNKYLKWSDSENDCLGVDAIGTIQILVYQAYCDGTIYKYGTPDNLKKEFCKAIDELCGKLIETEETKEGNA